jgi:hypothetical protein
MTTPYLFPSTTFLLYIFRIFVNIMHVLGDFCYRFIGWLEQNPPTISPLDLSRLELPEQRMEHLQLEKKGQEMCVYLW